MSVLKYGNIILLALSFGCTRPATPQPTMVDEKFTFESVKYTHEGKEKIARISKDNMLPLFADGVKNEIILEGSYGPGDSSVSTILVGVDFITITPHFKDGRWSATIDANKLEINLGYDLKANTKDGKTIAEAQLSISSF